MSDASQAVTNGIHHLGLTVPDITVTRNFFVQYLNFKEVGNNPDYPAVFISDGTVMLTLWQVRDIEKSNDFDRHHNIGLHHFALSVASQSALNDVYKTLASLDSVVVEFAPEPLGKSGTVHMMCTIPGGVRVEFIA